MVNGGSLQARALAPLKSEQRGADASLSHPPQTLSAGPREAYPLGAKPRVATARRRSNSSTTVPNTSDNSLWSERYSSSQGFRPWGLSPDPDKEISTIRLFRRQCLMKRFARSGPESEEPAEGTSARSRCGTSGRAALSPLPSEVLLICLPPSV